MTIESSALDRALATLREAIHLHRSPPLPDPVLRAALRDSVIQRFEYCFELAVRLLKRALRERAAVPDSVEARSFGDLMRDAAAAGLLDDPVAWMEFRDARNRTSHAYDEQQATAIVERIPAFAEAAALLASRIGVRT